MSRSAPPSGEAPAASSFEDALEELETIVERLERGDLPLEGALAAFEEGVRLSRRCAEQLDAAERRVEELIRAGGGATTKPFVPEDEA